mmetsp:Transcript_15832/g.31903  ORF Transcript_15832/g.31903 Transcript_15832/m.31903 type:complete len:376 (-) Transcript_15832:461-1588(-)
MHTALEFLFMLLMTSFYIHVPTRRGTCFCGPLCYGRNPDILKDPMSDIRYQIEEMRRQDRDHSNSFILSCGTMVLPPIETTPVIIFRFTSKADDELVTFVKERLIEGGIKVLSEDKISGGSTLLCLTTTQQELEREAELVKLVKPTTSALVGYAPDGEGTFRNNAILEHFTVSGRGNFVRYPDTYPKDVDPITEYDSMGLFTSSDRAMLVWSILDSINVLPMNSISSNLSRKFDELNIPYLHSRHYVQYDQITAFSKSVRRFPFSSRSTSKDGDDDKEISSQCLRHVLEDGDLADVITPAHIPHIVNKILKETLNPRTGAPLRAMREYYGCEIAFFFAWMLHFTKWLIAPGIMGLVVFVVRMFRGDSKFRVRQLV